MELSEHFREILCIIVVNYHLLCIYLQLYHCQELLGSRVLCSPSGGGLSLSDLGLFKFIFFRAEPQVSAHIHCSKTKRGKLKITGLVVIWKLMASLCLELFWKSYWKWSKITRNWCSHGGRALSDLTFIYKQVQITGCPLSRLSGINVMVSFSFFLVSIKPLQLVSILWLFAFVSLPGR